MDVTTCRFVKKSATKSIPRALVDRDCTKMSYVEKRTPAMSHVGEYMCVNPVLWTEVITPPPCTRTAACMASPSSSPHGKAAVRILHADAIALVPALAHHAGMHAAVKLVTYGRERRRTRPVRHHACRRALSNTGTEPAFAQNATMRAFALVQHVRVVLHG